MQTTHVVGGDPGLVHTGAVRLIFEPVGDRIYVEHKVIVGPDANEFALWAYGRGSTLINRMPSNKPCIFIEDYRQRSSFNTDRRMMEAVQKFKAATKGKALDNMGVKKIVKRQLMETLGVWQFATPTHHQDLRSAARIALFGMLKDEALNAIVTAAVKAKLAGRPWQVIHN